MDIVRTIEKVEGDKVTIRTTTLSTDTSKVTELKEFFLGRQVQLNKLNQKYDELMNKLDKIKIVGDEKEILDFEEKNKEMLKRLGALSMQNNLKFQLQGVEIEKEKINKDILALQDLLNQIKSGELKCVKSTISQK